MNKIEVATYQDDELTATSRITLVYDDRHRIARFREKISRAGQSRLLYTYFTYEDRLCRMVQKEDGDVISEQSYFFNDDGLCTRIVDGNGHETSLAYQDGRLTRCGETELGWEQDDIVKAVRDDAACTFTYYDLDNPFYGTVDWVSQLGKWLPGDPMGYSFCGPYNRHLLHTASSSGSDGQWNWDYQFDDNEQLQGYTLTFLDNEYGPIRQEIKFYH